ncbi:MAG: hypothetical protein ABSF59_03825 [Candidatus Sulfotelmatobacter sp.]|jgi:hypothetical protein
MIHNPGRPRVKLPNAPQPPLSHPGAAPDSDRARRPPLAEPAAGGPQLNPGDRVEGLGDFGKPTGDFGTVEQSNDDDALVKWDDDGRVRLQQPWLRKI